MGVYTIENNVPIDLGALGMPEPSDKHWRFANFFTREISKLVSPQYEAGTEAVTSKNKHYRVVDFAVKKFYKGGSDILFFIEICHKKTYNDAIKRIKDILKDNTAIKEIFIFQYDDNRFEKVYDKNTIKIESYSDFLNRDLKELTKDFYKYVYETSI